MGHMSEYKLHQSAAALVRDAGGELVGRTRLQKVAYLTQLAGFADDFQFDYRHFGPFSEELAEAMEIAAGLRFVVEEERHTEWGGWDSDRKSVVEGTSVSVRVDLGGRRIIQHKIRK